MNREKLCVEEVATRVLATVFVLGTVWLAAVFLLSATMGMWHALKALAQGGCA